MSVTICENICRNSFHYKYKYNTLLIEERTTAQLVLFFVATRISVKTKLVKRSQNIDIGACALDTTAGILYEPSMRGNGLEPITAAMFAFVGQSTSAMVIEVSLDIFVQRIGDDSVL